MFCLISIQNVVHKFTSTFYLYWLPSTSINNNMYYIVHIYNLTSNNGTIKCMWFEKYKYLWLELTLRSSLSPTRQVGVKAMERNRVRGYQNQNWVKTSIPTTPSMFMWPVRDCSEIVMLRPPETEKKGCPVTRSIILSFSLNSMSWFCGKYSGKKKMTTKNISCEK